MGYKFRVALFVVIAVGIQAVSVLSVVNDSSTADGDNSGSWDNDTDDNNTDIIPVRDPPKILLKSRQFTPEPGINQTFETELLASKDAAVHVLIQLYHTPTEAERKLLEESGVKLLAYIPKNAWFASISPRNITRIAALQEVRWVGKILPEDKIAPDLRDGIDSWEVNDDGSMNLTLLFFSDVSLNDARKLLLSYGGTRFGNGLIIPDSSSVAVVLPNETIPYLASEDSVQWIEVIPPFGAAGNDGSLAAIGVNTLQTAPYNLDGTDVQIGIWEWNELVNITHSDFAGRVTIGDTGNFPAGDHPTHVTGTMLGNGTLSESGGGYPLQWRGVATNATAVSYEDWQDGGITELNNEYDDAINNHGIDISQNSWGGWYGGSDKYGRYDEETRKIDTIVWGDITRPINIVWLSGNARDEDWGWPGCDSGEYDCIPVAGTGKNVITVGATNSNDDSMTSFSGWGPTNDNRIKPDVVAPGSQRYGDGGIKSTLPGDTYGVMGGTSMAAPAVSGTIALMLQDYRATHNDSEPLPSTMKAILLHTAKDINNTGPDYTSGYGRIDAFAAISVIEADNSPQKRIVEAEINDSQIDAYNITVPAGTPELKFTLVWDDYPGTPNGGKMLVNNLDLAVTAPDGTKYYPWILNPNNPSAPATTGIDSINNVEQVVINSPASGTYNITINGTNVPESPQTYSLILPDIIHPTVTITSPSDTINDTTPDLSFTVDEPANTIYAWDAEGNVTGCRMCTSFNVTYGEAAPDANTSLLFHFNENHSNRAYDDSGTGNDGMIYGTTWTAGRFGNALEFYGKKYHYVRVPDSAALALNDSFTLSAWINSKNSTAKQGIIYKIDPWIGYHLNLMDGNDSMKLRCMVHDNASTTDVISASPLTPNEWYYVACVRDKPAGKVYLYVNGTLVGNATDSTINKSILNSNPLIIGSNHEGWLSFFNGTIDEVAIYNRSLSAEEIQELYNKSLFDDGVHNVTVYASDTAGNMRSSTAWFILNNYTIPLTAGWNLISIPVVPENTSLQSVLASIEGNYSVVYAWIGGGWRRSTDNRNPLAEIVPEYGYWIYMTAQDTLELNGTVPSSTTININPGWNLVGYPSFTSRDITTVLSSIDYSIVYAWTGNGWKRSTDPRDPLTQMDTGYGYWIYANSAGSYEVTNGNSASSSSSSTAGTAGSGSSKGTGSAQVLAGGDTEALASASDPLPPAFPTLMDMNLLNQNGSNIDTDLLLTIDYFDSDSNQQAINSVDDAGDGSNGTVFWGIYNGKSNLYTLPPAKDGTNITITVEGYEPLVITAVEGGTISGDYNLT